MAATVALLAGAFVLASRSEPEARPRPEPTPAAPTVTGANWRTGPYTLKVATGGRNAYALSGACRANQCSYRVFRRDAGSAWAVLPELPEARGVDGRTARLVTWGDESVAVIEERSGRAWVSTDGGAHFGLVRLEAGDSVPAVPAGLRAQEGNCAGCPGVATVLALPSGVRRPLETQPWPRLPIAALTDDGRTLWAVGDVDGSLQSAVSTDRGRTWRTSPLPGSRTVLPTLQLLSAPGGGVYLIAEGGDPWRGAFELWAVDGPGRTWQRLRADVSKLQYFQSAVVNTAGTLLLFAGGVLFERPVGGAVSQVDVLTGVPQLDQVVAGRDGTLFGRASPNDRNIWFSPDGGRTWAAEALPT